MQSIVSINCFAKLWIALTTMRAIHLPLCNKDHDVYNVHKDYQGICRELMQTELNSTLLGKHSLEVNKEKNSFTTWLAQAVAYKNWV